MDVVVIPVWRRADFLLATLTRLEIINDPEVSYLISVDRGYSPDVLTAIDEFSGSMGLDRVKVIHRVHRFKGNSFNVLSSLREACDRGPELVHLVEEDVLVGRDYFTYHRQVHDLVPDAFSVSACRNQRFPLKGDPPPHEDAVYRDASYQSVGVSFRPDQLSYPLAHVTSRYFSNPIGYCRRIFPNSFIPPGNAEQDGLLHRVLEQTDSFTVYPMIPRAYHAGFVGYHRRGEELKGTLWERAERILSMTSEELNSCAHSYPDHATIDLDGDRKPVSRIGTWP